jgi:hypothetical protein
MMNAEPLHALELMSASKPFGHQRSALCHVR